jgi:hypothetical protein
MVRKQFSGFFFTSHRFLHEEESTVCLSKGEKKNFVPQQSLHTDEEKMACSRGWGKYRNMWKKIFHIFYPKYFRH